MINRYHIIQHCKTFCKALQVIKSFAMLQDVILLIMKKTCDFGSLSEISKIENKQKFFYVAMYSINFCGVFT